jgi:hypothetical protein
MRACPPSLCAAQHYMHEHALRCRWEQQLARDVLQTSTRGCDSARRGAQRGRLLQCECCVGGCLPARKIGECRRRSPSADPSASSARGGMGREAGDGGGGAPASPPPRTPRASHSVPPIASACACTRAPCGLGRLCGAAQRYPKLFWTAPSAPRSSSSATDSVWPLYAASCSGVHLHGRRRRGLGRHTPPIAASGNGAPAAVLGVHVGAGCDERSDDSAIAAFRRPVQRGVAKAAHGGAGVRGWAPRGYALSQPEPERKTARTPRGSTVFSIWINVNGKSSPRGLNRVLTISPIARASTKRAKLKKVAETANAARNCEIRQYGRRAYGLRNVAS